MQIHIEGLDAHIQAVVKEAVEDALAGHSDDDPWLTSDEAAKVLGCARSTIHDLVSAGKLQRAGGRKTRILIKRSTLDKYIEERGRS